MEWKIVLLSLGLLLTVNSSALAECNQEQAFNKMMALGEAKKDVRSEMDSLPAGPKKNQVMQRWASLGREIAEVGKLLGGKQYTEACAEYDEIASKYAINLEEVSKRAPNMAGLKKE